MKSAGMLAPLMKGARGLVSLVILVWSVLASGSALASASPTVLAGEHQVAIAVWSVPLTPRGHVSRSLVYFAEAERFGNAATGEQVRALSATNRR